MMSVSSGVASMQTGNRLPLASSSSIAPGAGEKPFLQVLGQVEGLSHGGDGGSVLLEQQLEGGVLEESPAQSGR